MTPSLELLVVRTGPLSLPFDASTLPHLGLCDKSLIGLTPFLFEPMSFALSLLHPSGLYASKRPKYMISVECNESNCKVLSYY
jgi:hypothetical protein